MVLKQLTVLVLVMMTAVHDGAAEGPQKCWGQTAKDVRSLTSCLIVSALMQNGKLKGCDYGQLGEQCYMIETNDGVTEMGCGCTKEFYRKQAVAEVNILWYIHRQCACSLVPSLKWIERRRMSSASTKCMAKTRGK